MDIKLLVCDLDDTLINDESGVTDRALNAINKVRENGIKVAIATGRMHFSAFPYAKTMDIVEPIISYNGALIKHVDSDEVLLHLPVKYDAAIEVLQFAKDENRFIQYYTDSGYYVKNHSDESDWYGQRTGTRAVETGEDLIKSLDFDPTKLLMMGKDKKDTLRLCKIAEEKFKEKLNITRSSDTYIEFNHIDASKGNACDFLAKHYGYNLSNVMSIGNGGNDVDMIKRTGVGVAVMNAVDEAKNVADYICPSQEDDGAAEAIEKYLLNG